MERPPRALSLLCVALCAVLFAGACSDGDDGGTPGSAPTSGETSAPEPTVTEEATVIPTPALPSCPNQEAVASDGSFRGPGRLVGELDDDGVQDEVFLAVDESGEPGCRAFIVIESEGSLRSAPIEVTDIPFAMGFPRLISLPLIDARPGAEIVVGVQAGASTQFAAVFTVVDGAVVPMLREGSATLEQSLLAFGGSVGHQDAVDCAPEVGPGVVVISSAQPVGGGARFRYVRSFFRTDEPARFVEDPSLREGGTIAFDRFDSLHEFPNAPFGSCPAGEVAG